MDIANRFRTKSFGLLFAFGTVYPSAGQQFLIELLQFQGCQLGKWDTADIGLDVVINIAAVGLMRGGTDF